MPLGQRSPIVNDSKGADFHLFDDAASVPMPCHLDRESVREDSHALQFYQRFGRCVGRDLRGKPIPNHPRESRAAIIAAVSPNPIL